MEPYIITEIDLYNTEIMRKTRSNVLYSFLITKIVRAKMNYDPCNIYETKYKNGILSTAWTNRALVKKINRSKGRVSQLIKELESCGAVKVERLGRYRPNIFTLGKIYNDKEILYTSDLAREELDVPGIYDKNISPEKIREMTAIALKKMNKKVKIISE